MEGWVEVRKIRKMKRENLEENDQVSFLGWQTRKKNQEIPQKEALQ